MSLKKTWLVYHYIEGLLHGRYFGRIFVRKLRYSYGNNTETQCAFCIPLIISCSLPHRQNPVGKAQIIPIIEATPILQGEYLSHQSLQELQGGKYAETRLQR